jgi:multiple sugar transport system ATP-binding protein
MTRVQLKEVTKRFRRGREVVTAVSDFSLTAESGEFLVIVGPSGCGKTTLLRLIAGLEKQDSGHIYLDDVLVDDVPVGKRGVQMIFQSYALWPHMKVLDERRYSNISFALKIRKWSLEDIAVRLGDVTRRVGLESKLFSCKPDQISAGQKQRVALARAITTSPKVFLMDEPITNLDPPSRVKVRQEIKQWHTGIAATTLYVTHNMTDASVMADRIAIMRDGQLVQVGTVQELIENPADEFVRDYLRS